MSDEHVPPDVVAAAMQHDEQASAALIRCLYPLVARIVRAHRPPRSAEEDLCQMIFIKTLRKLPQFSGVVPIEHWVSRIAVNTCLNQVQWEKARPELREADLSEEQVAVVREIADTREDLGSDRRFVARDLVEHLMQNLKPAERLVIDMLYLRQLPVAEVQNATGWSAARIKVQAFRARQKMKKLFDAIAASEGRQ